MGQRPIELTPRKSPQHYWGAELRAWRNQRRLSVEELGRQINYDKSQLARIERGVRPAPMPVVRACDVALGAAGALVRLHHQLFTERIQPDAARFVEGSHVANQTPHVAKVLDQLVPEEDHQAPWETVDEITFPARTHDGKVILVSVPRRLFLRGLGGAALGIAADSAASSPAKVPSPQIALKHFEQMRQTLADSDNLFGPRQVIPAVKQQLSLMQMVERPQHSATRQSWMRVETEFADLAGWLYQDSGNHRAALYWLDRSLEWSYQTCDPDDVVFMLTRKSQLALDMQDPGEAIGLAEAALRLSRPRSRLAAIAATYAGHGHAINGDRASSEREYDQARGLFTTADDDQAPWGQFFDMSYIAVWQAGSRTLLGDYQAAADEYQAAIAALPPGFRRDSGLYLAREAVALAGGQHIDQAAAVGLQALEIGVETGSGRIFTELGTLSETLSRWHSSATSQFQEALTEALPHQI